MGSDESTTPNAPTVDTPQPCCAHLRVIWTTDTDRAGLTLGWWECSDCETPFVPHAALLAARREVEEAKKERERVRVVHLRRHQRLAAALGLDDGYSVDATIDEAIRRAATQEER